MPLCGQECTCAAMPPHSLARSAVTRAPIPLRMTEHSVHSCYSTSSAGVGCACVELPLPAFEWQRLHLRYHCSKQSGTRASPIALGAIECSAAVEFIVLRAPEYNASLDMKRAYTASITEPTLRGGVKLLAARTPLQTGAVFHGYNQSLAALHPDPGIVLEYPGNLWLRDAMSGCFNSAVLRADSNTASPPICSQQSSRTW